MKKTELKKQIKSLEKKLIKLSMMYLDSRETIRVKNIYINNLETALSTNPKRYEDVI